MKVLDLTLPTPAENLACDEALLTAAESGERGETLRFWTPAEHFVVVGYANKVATEVNLPACETLGVPILRRCSGGGTVLQGPGCLNYALFLCITEDGPTRSIGAANQFIMQRNRAAVARLVADFSPSVPKVEVCGHTDLALVNSQPSGITFRKFSGNAQRRQRRFLLFHGTFLLNFDLGRIAASLRLPSHQPEYRQRRTHREFLTNLAVSSEALKLSLQSAWSATEKGEPLAPGHITALVTQKYSRAEWNLCR